MTWKTPARCEGCYSRMFVLWAVLSFFEAKIVTIVVPYRANTFQTDLSEAAILTIVKKHTHIGQWDGAFIKSKPYFGALSPGYFEIRQCGRFKKYGYGPALSARIAPQATGSLLEITVKPHMMLVGLAILLLAPCAIFLLMHVVAFFGTWDARPIMSFATGTAIIAACFLLPYHFGVQRTFQFWKKALRCLNVRRLFALGALRYLERDFLAFLERFEAAHLNGGKVGEKVFTFIVWCDEAITLGVIKPFHSTGRHGLSFLQRKNQTKLMRAASPRAIFCPYLSNSPLQFEAELKHTPNRGSQ
jgi:hypothetical protein